MKIIQFLKSRTFVKQIVFAVIIVCILVFILINFLGITTNHDEVIDVPDLTNVKISIAEQKLNDLGLEVLILDTIDYNADYLPFSIVEQDPEFGDKVKDGRKVYVKINAGGYAMITMPDIKDKTYRQLQAVFRAIGIKEGNVLYKPNLAKDLVLAVKLNGKALKKGDKILKNTVVDLELGDGKRTFEETFINGADSLVVIQPEIDVDVPKLDD
ncbi:PASTA domain-containing protein [uncultured Flavobacterium sp.]|uniref:PASTA domain-containing protein n=1 Tax=uncultured Flavobacterium sp. TaxID=165435 RepID=UPI0030CA1EB4|tara:strand:+ start:490 stop:1128 length:639 start_codon:yes stop_codon:yes gene_type:complete